MLSHTKFDSLSKAKQQNIKYENNWKSLRSKNDFGVNLVLKIKQTLKFYSKYTEESEKYTKVVHKLFSLLNTLCAQ